MVPQRLGFLWALCLYTLTGAFAFEPLNLERAGGDPLPLALEPHDSDDLGLSGRSLLQTYPPTYPTYPPTYPPSPSDANSPTEDPSSPPPPTASQPVASPPPPGTGQLEEVPPDAPPLSNDQGVSSTPITISSSLKVPGNGTERAAIMSSILADIRGEGVDPAPGQENEAFLRKRKVDVRRLLSGRSTAEALLNEALLASDLAESGEIRMFFTTNADGTVSEDQNLDFEINLFVPDGLTDAERAQAANDVQNRVASDDVVNQVEDDWREAVSNAVSASGLSNDLVNQLDSSLASGFFGSEVTSDDGAGSSGAVAKTGLLTLFISAAAVLLLA
ncbi:hypothetical protein DUNSADRAFT_12159 [Dunaliella salina]|uniref:Encoded protein n=1 Tax=Dunaliella salina TaxID=3046 RepID=A0ABQ7GBX6_DUNSA|nr:hypothetical protein DUNSADRAFT_12159 [Dunaliella salina]|eukprot:KAF5832110.1 hypothetical protein DUNSADRAFT_12159 [Dunaliella salina]